MALHTSSEWISERLHTIWSHTVPVVDRAKLQVQQRAFQLIANRLLGTLEKASDDRIIDFMRKVEAVVPLARHKVQVRQLRELFEAGHPAIELFRRILRLHPTYRRSFITNLGFNALWFGDQKRKAFARDHGITPPFLMVMSPIMRCNLRCLGCYAGNFPRGNDPLPFEELDRAVSEAKQMGIYFITISGGEPFLRHDLLDLYEKHPDCTFLIYTNGTMIDDHTIERMQRVGNVAPAISVEGFAEQTNARRGTHKGRPVFDIVIETMDRLREAGCMFGFSATATRLNADVYLQDEFYDLMIEKGAIFGWFFIFVPVGQDAGVDLMVTPEQRDRLRAKTYQVRATRPLFVADFWNDGCLTGGCMSAGSTYFHINYRGDLEPCVFVHFATDNLIDLHARGGHLWDVLNTPFFQALRDCNRAHGNPLRPCPIIDHNEDLEEAVRIGGAHPTNEGAEDVIGRIKDDIRAWAAAYAPFAEAAWNSGQYDWAKDAKSAINLDTDMSGVQARH